MEEGEVDDVEEMERMIATPPLPDEREGGEAGDGEEKAEEAVGRGQVGGGAPACEEDIIRNKEEVVRVILQWELHILLLRPFPLMYFIYPPPILFLPSSFPSSFLAQIHRRHLEMLVHSSTCQKPDCVSNCI